MSDDLISRKALLEVIDISFIIPILKMNLRPEHEAVLKIREIIMNIPTAFDKEKVIEELKGQIELVSYNPMTAGRYIKKIEQSRLSRKVELNNVIHRLSLLFLQRPNDRS